MLHSVKVIGVGFVLLALCLLAGRMMGAAGQRRLFFAGGGKREHPRPG
jgi:Na+-transporting methylmalonyl-CoA/oxaloacetate decarboxylase gamma subunit